MTNYLDTVDKKVLEYFKVLESEFPEWLFDYINTKEMLFLKDISITCGTIYSNLFESNFFFSTLDHSIAVALIIWHFTHDKKETLAGLFHDIATPVFKHCIDFLYGDYEQQEATEDLTRLIIKESSEIMYLLKRDNINIDEIDNYHNYPIADNDTPQLSADRLEYSLSNALFTYKIVDIDCVKQMYEDIYIEVNENNEHELSFETLFIALKFVEITTKLSIIYREDRTRYSMQFLADIIKNLHIKNVITIEDLYKLKEKDVIEIIQKSEYCNAFNTWATSKEVKVSKYKPNNVYCVKIGAKVRYINPLVKKQRCSKISTKAKNLIETNLSYKMDNYIWLDGINF